MENAPIRTAPPAGPAQPAGRAASVRSGAAPDTDALQGFSLLLADIAGPAETQQAVSLAEAIELPDPAAAGLAGMVQDPFAAGERILAQEAALSQPSLTDGLSDGGMLAFTSLIGQTARMDSAADAAVRDGRTPAPGMGAAPALPMGAGPRALGLQQALTAAAARSGSGAQAGDTPLPSVTADIASNNASASADASTLSLQAPERGAQPRGLAALLAQMEAEPLPRISELAGTQRLEAMRGAPGQPQAGNDALGAIGGPAQSAPLDSAAGADAAMATDAVLAAPDEALLADQLSEQVAFWVQQKTQRAELTIDRQGQPVQVQVTITGNEAHVTFRSDEQQTRDMLDAGMAQLREMLEQQGLSLAGVTVQTADAGRQGASSGRGPSGRPQAPAGSVGERHTAVVSADLRARPDALRAVDLFV